MQPPTVTPPHGDPSPSELRSVARVAQGMAYAAGIAGVVAGAVLLRRGEAPLATAVWVLTFAVGAVLQVAGFVARGTAAVLSRVERIERDVTDLLHDRWRGHD